MKIPDHSHEYLIPIATQEEIREGTSQDSVVVPKILGTASLYSYETFAPLEQVVNARQESEKSMARANSAQQVAEESKRVSDQALTEVTKTGEAVTAATTTANLAKDTADTAKGLAEESKSASDAAKQMAEEAKALSEQSKNACAEVKASVATVKIVAESAQTGVEQASQTASEAKGLAESAKSAAESVTEKVDQALREASDAKSKAEGLETIANEAKSTSDQASQTALSAKSLSEEAKEVAETAKSTAEEAKSVAEQAKEEADTTKQGLGEVKSSLDTVTATTNSANTAASEAKVLAEEAKSALTEVQEKAQRNSDSLSELQSKVGSLSTNFLENVRFNQPNRILEDDPENRKGLVINNGACFRFYHGGENGGRYLFYRVPRRGRMTFDKDLEAGKDYYIYLIPTLTNNNEISFEISQNPTAPDGYTEDTSKKIGGFHTLCADVGEIEDHPLSGYQAGDILPDSVWCLNHRPRSDPEGMVYDPWKNIWVDIYLQSGTDENTKSAYGVPITTNRSYSDHHVDFSSVNKRFLTSDEFASCMCGINSGTSIIGNKAPSLKTSGGHVDTNNRRMISHIGCE
uniref:phage major tropism determinant n=1 Tax=unclassified Bartonella TaxID=2645622 RepID=UPI0035CF807F